MAPVDEVLSICSSYIDQNHCVNEVNKCLKCSRMRNYLKVLTTELKSAQSIIRVLIEELNVNECNILASSNESSNSQVHRYMNSVSNSVWTEIRKNKNHLTNLQTQTSGCSNHIEHSSQALPSVTKYSIPVSNRFIPLDNKYEPQEKNLGILPQRKYKNFKETRRDKTSYMNHHQATKNNEE
jgi:hypothetical protein